MQFGRNTKAKQQKARTSQVYPQIWNLHPKCLIICISEPSYTPNILCACKITHSSYKAYNAHLKFKVQNYHVTLLNILKSFNFGSLPHISFLLLKLSLRSTLFSRVSTLYLSHSCSFQEVLLGSDCPH